VNFFEPANAPFPPRFCGFAENLGLEPKPARGRAERTASAPRLLPVSSGRGSSARRIGSGAGNVFHKKIGARLMAVILIGVRNGAIAFFKVADQFG
jgi:hypothetical protein